MSEYGTWSVGARALVRWRVLARETKVVHAGFSGSVWRSIAILLDLKLSGFVDLGPMDLVVASVL